jgi:competence protein ComEA
VEEWWERHRRILLLVLIIAAVTGLVLFQVLRPQPAPIILSTATPLPSPEATLTPRPLRVYVSGAVLHPDVYTLIPDSIVKDALLAAGGPTEDADLDRINLALPLSDGQHIYVPRLGEQSPPVQPPSRLPAVSGKINLNTADVAVLETLPGIGPVLAQRIVDYRQEHGTFAQIEDLMNVSGIGQRTFDNLRDLITTD